MIKVSVSSLLAFSLLTVPLYGQKAPAKEEDNSVDHAGILQSLDNASQARGKSTYGNLIVEESAGSGDWIFSTTQTMTQNLLRGVVQEQMYSLWLQNQATLVTNQKRSSDRVPIPESGEQLQHNPLY